MTYRAPNYAEIYTNEGAGTSNLTTGGTFQKLDQFDSDGSAASDATADSANNRILVGPGRYLVGGSASFDGTNSGAIQLKVYSNSVAQPQLAFQRTLGNPSRIGAAAFGPGIVVVTAANTPIEVWWTSGSDNDDIEIKEIQLTAERVG